MNQNRMDSLNFQRSGQALAQPEAGSGCEIPATINRCFSHTCLGVRLRRGLFAAEPLLEHHQTEENLVVILFAGAVALLHGGDGGVA